MTKSAKKNYDVGRTYYHVIVDSHGYPNGMAYWEEMEPKDKYYYCISGIQMLEDSVAFGFVTAMDPEIGLDGIWGDGDCKALMDYIESVQDEEKEAFEARVAAVQAATSR